MRAALPGLALAVALAGCQRKPEPPAPSLGTMRFGEARPDPRFDAEWRALAERGDEESEVFYIEDDRGEGMMARVRRDKRTVPRPAAASATPARPPGPREQPDSNEVSAAIRSNLAGIKACYLRLTREGRLISGRAILSFTVEKDGSARDVRVDAPAFAESGLPRCVSQQVERWTFPKSKRGGLAVSYPFVFVGG